jgi:hypothetical protein
MFNLIEIFSISLMVAFAINSFKLASQDGMIFGKFYNWILCNSTYYWVHRYRNYLNIVTKYDLNKVENFNLLEDFKTDIENVDNLLDKVQKRKFYYILKPILFCPTCMSSVWSLPILFIEPIYYPFVVICTSVIATYIYDRLFPNYE